MTNRFASDKIAELVMGLKKLISKNKLKKFLTKANEFDKINELLIERTAKKLKKLQKIHSFPTRRSSDHRKSVV